MAWLPLLVLAAALVLLVVANEGWPQVLPFVLLIGLFVFTAYRSRLLVQLDAQVLRVQELAMLRHYPPAMRLAWRLVPRLTTIPPLHHRVVAFLAHLLDQVRAYEAAIIAYNFLLDGLPQDHPAAAQFEIHRAMAQLAIDRLTDADDALRRLRRHDDAQGQPATAAALRLAQLIQQVRTNHFDDLVASAPRLVDDLRALGVEAGYGHALVAYAYHMLDDEPPSGRRAGPWWSRATLLMPASALVERFPELRAMTNCYPTASALPPHYETGRGDSMPNTTAVAPPKT